LGGICLQVKTMMIGLALLIAEFQILTAWFRLQNDLFNGFQMIIGCKKMIVVRDWITDGKKIGARRRQFGVTKSMRLEKSNGLSRYFVGNR